MAAAHGGKSRLGELIARGGDQHGDQHRQEGKLDFEDLLAKVSSAHSDALRRLEVRNEVLTEEISKLRDALSRLEGPQAGSVGSDDDDVEQSPTAPPQLQRDCLHTMFQQTRSVSSSSKRTLVTRPSSLDDLQSTGVDGLDVDTGQRKSINLIHPQQQTPQRLQKAVSGVKDSCSTAGSGFFPGTAFMPRKLSSRLPSDLPLPGGGVRDPDMVEVGSSRLLTAVRRTNRKSGPASLSLTPGSFQITWKRAVSVVRAKALKKLRYFINSFGFDIFCTLVIVVNAISVGYEVHILARGLEVPFGLRVLDILICIWYGIEFVLRLWADRFTQNPWWNFFDFVMLVACIVDLTINLQHVPRNYTVVRFLRFVRLLRVLKMLKIGKTVNNYFIVFSKMTYCLLQSLPSLTSAALVIVVFTYISSVLLTQMATDYREDLIIDEIGLEEYYGSLDRTFYSLVKTTFNGQAWGELMRPLTFVSFISSFIFMTYLIVTLLCFLNVIQGVFVDSALQSTAHYKDLIVAEAQQKKITLLEHLQDVFHEIDTDRSGYITVQEFEACLATPGGRAFFEVMGLSTVQAQELFRLIDGDASQTVDIDEFCQGCLQVMGEAKNFDIQCIIAENRKVLHRWTYFIDNFESTLRTTVAKALLQAPVGPPLSLPQRKPGRHHSSPMHNATGRRHSLEFQVPESKLEMQDGSQSLSVTEESQKDEGGYDQPEDDMISCV